MFVAKGINSDSAPISPMKFLFRFNARLDRLRR